jgi:peptide deformylase
LSQAAPGETCEHESAMTKRDVDKLYIIHYPDPRLRAVAEDVTSFDGELQALVARMVELLAREKGLGLAAPQLGINKRLAIISPTGQPDDIRVLVNPVLHDLHGSLETEEGCLSLPGINVQVRRAQRCRVTAQDLAGRKIEQTLEDLPARICQHETDHLNGVLIIDRMGPSDRVATRRTLKALEDSYKTRAAR